MLNPQNLYTTDYVHRESTLKEAKKQTRKSKTASLKAYMNTMAQRQESNDTDAGILTM